MKKRGRGASARRKAKKTTESKAKVKFLLPTEIQNSPPFGAWRGYFARKAKLNNSSAG